MVVLGCIAIGLVAALFVCGAGAGRRETVGRVAAGVGGAMLAGLVAVGTGIGGVGEFFDPGVWVIALGGAIVALFVFEVLHSSEVPADRIWSRAGRESEHLDRNW
jgi:hypothetical protein